MAADDADFVTEEFLKKEFSLAKPYRGELGCQRLHGCPAARLPSPCQDLKPLRAPQTELMVTGISDRRTPGPSSKMLIVISSKIGLAGCNN